MWRRTAGLTPYWLNTIETEAIYTGQNGKNYTFYSIARDATGNIETAPAAADAATEISAPVKAFEFRCNYSSGDYHRGGVVYAEAGTSYDRVDDAADSRRGVTDEYGQTSYYEITGISPEVADRSKSGQVFVNTYHDAEANQDFTPLKHGQMVGAGYLGSEYDYIIAANKPQYYFGGGFF